MVAVTCENVLVKECHFMDWDLITEYDIFCN